MASIKNGRFTFFTLDGSDLEITGNFDCSKRQLVSLNKGPRKIGGNFNCSRNQLTTLEGGPEEVGGSYFCFNNRLTSLVGAPPKVGGDFYCSSNIKLTSLKGGPIEVGGNFKCTDSGLTTLEGCPVSISGDFDCSGNRQLSSLKDIHKQIKWLNGTFKALQNPIKSHVLGLLLIPGTQAVMLDNLDVEEILNKHLPNTRGSAAVLEAQSALLDAGLEEFAQL